MVRPQVLVVDDNLDQHTICTAYLTHAGYEVVHAFDGNEGLERAREEGTRLIVTDILMPRMDGVALLRALRNEPTTRNLPVVAWSAALVEWDEEKALGVGFDAFLPKPCSLARLRALADQFASAG